MSTNPVLPAKFYAAIIAQLDKGEEVQWVGRPNPWAYLLSLVLHDYRGRTMVILLVVLLGCWWMASIDSPPASRFEYDLAHMITSFALLPFGIPLLMDFSWKWWRAKRCVVYLITDRRALILEVYRYSMMARSIGLGHGSTVFERRERSSGSGDLLFRQAIVGLRQLPYHACGFLGIDRVSEVEAMARRVHTELVQPRQTL